MSESESAILKISGTLTLEDYKSAVMARNIRAFIKAVVVFILAVIVLVAILTLFQTYPYLKNGEATVKEVAEIALGVFTKGAMPFILIGFIALYAILLFLIRPYQTMKRMRELYPGGIAFVYNFYEDRLEASSTSKTGDSTVRFKYSDVQRKIKETSYAFVLSTEQRNRYLLFKRIMTPDEAAAVRELLSARCPQGKRHAA